MNATTKTACLLLSLFVSPAVIGCGSTNDPTERNETTQSDDALQARPKKPGEVVTRIASVDSLDPSITKVRTWSIASLAYQGETHLLIAGLDAEATGRSYEVVVSDVDTERKSYIVYGTDRTGEAFTPSESQYNAWRRDFEAMGDRLHNTSACSGLAAILIALAGAGSGFVGAAACAASWAITPIPVCIAGVLVAKASYTHTKDYLTRCK